jgi:hypothetical protein
MNVRTNCAVFDHFKSLLTAAVIIVRRHSESGKDGNNGDSACVVQVPVNEKPVSSKR